MNVKPGGWKKKDWEDAKRIVEGTRTLTETEIAEKIKAASQPAQTQTYNSSSSYNNDDYYYDDYSYDDDDYYYEDNSSYNDYDYDTNDGSSDDEGGNEDSCLDGGLLY